MIQITSIEVWPKKNKKKEIEPGAFMVKIVRSDGSEKSKKWLKSAPGTHPTGMYISLTRIEYAQICDLINQSHKKSDKVVWSKGQGVSSKGFDKGAYANEMRGRAAGAC